MSAVVDAWFNPGTLLTHLSEKCAKQQGRPARKTQGNLLPSMWDGLWCERCSPEEKRIGILEGK